MDSRYNVYFDGQLLEGQDMASVRQQLARLFNADEQTLDKLFSGKSQLIKRECDRATALKFKQAIEQAGARPIIMEVGAEPATQPKAQAAPTPDSKMTAAERIAALAQAPDQGKYTATPAQPGGSQAEAEPTQAGSQADASPAGGIDLAPQGTAVLRPEERQQPVTREVDTSGMAVDDSGGELSEPQPPPPQAPDTDHLSMGAAGEILPTLPRDFVPVQPNIDALDLTPAGTGFSDCAAPEAEMPALDLSGINLAPAGAEVLEEKYRQKQEAKAPATDHISLED